jgi:hypothetical protein
LIRSGIYDSEINDAILNVKNHPMMKAMMGFTFPDVADAVWKEQLSKHILFVIFNVILYTIPFKSFREEFRWFNNLRI